MGAAYFVVLNTDGPAFDPFINGKALARNVDKIDVVANSLGFKTLNGYFSKSATHARAEMAALLGIEDENKLPPAQEETIRNMPPEEWFDADHGLAYAVQVSEYIRETPGCVDEPEEVLDDLAELREVMIKAGTHGLKWHFLIDY